MWKFLVIFCILSAVKSCRVEEKADEDSPRREDHPSHVLVETFLTFEKKYWCSGVLISANYVLTTAECVLDLNFVNVHIYAFNLRDVFEAEREIYKSSVVEFKPSFDRSKYLNDLALIKLPITLNVAEKSYSIAQLPPFADQLVEGMEGNSVGWGLLNYSDNKASAFKITQVMKVVSDEKCREAYPKWSDESEYSGRNCIQKEAGNNCASDVGSPFFIGNVIFGLQSFGQMEACSLGLPNGIQEVRFHAGWILQVLNKI